MRKSLYIALCALGTSIASQAAVVITSSGVEVVIHNQSFGIDLDGDSTVDLEIQNFADAGGNYRYIAAVTPTTSGTDSEISSSIAASNTGGLGLDPFGLIFGGQIQSADGFSDAASALGATTSFTGGTTYLAGSFAFNNENDSDWVTSPTSSINAVLAVRFESTIPTGSPAIYNGFVDLTFNNGSATTQTVAINSFGYENLVPEPSSALLCSLAVFGLLRRRR